MRKKTFWVLVALAVLLLPLLAACTQTKTVVVTKEVEKVVTKEVEKVVTKEVEKVVTKEVEKPRVEIRLSGWAASPEETHLLESLLYRFSLEHPDIVVKYEPITGDYWQKLATMIASGTEPDVFYMDIFQFPAYATRDVLLPIDDLMANAGVSRDEFLPALIDAFTWNGTTYGIPKDFNTLALFYNKRLFEKAGLAEPTDDWTWDDLRAAAEALTGIEEEVYGLGVPPDPGRFPIFVFQNGGAIMTEDFSDTLLDSPEAVAAAEFYTGFRKDGIGAIPSDVGDGWQGTSFGREKFAMVFEGGWLIPYLNNQFPDLQYGAVTPPAGPKGEGNLVFTVAYVISKRSKNPEAAFELIKFLTNEESQVAVLTSGFALPSRQALQNHEYLQENPNVAAIFRGVADARPFMWGLHGSDVNDAMAKALERVYLEGVSPEQALKDEAAKLRQILKED